jgi:cold shock CspA family protein
MADTKTTEEKPRVAPTPWVLPEGSQSEGVITFYHRDKKWGRISPDSSAGSPSIFFHITGFTTRRMRPVRGYGVSFTVSADQSKLKATGISLSEASAKVYQDKVKERSANRVKQAKQPEATAPKKDDKPKAAAAESKAATSARQRVSNGKSEGKPAASADKNADASGGSSAAKEAKERREITVNSTLIGEFPGSTDKCTVKLYLDAYRIVSSLKKKCCRAMHVTDKDIKMLRKDDVNWVDLARSDFDTLKAGDSFDIQIVRTN